MTGPELRDARATLAKMWNLEQPVSMADMGRLLRLKGRDPGATIRDWERRDGPTGPAAVAVHLMLAGALPPDFHKIYNADDEWQN